MNTIVVTIQSYHLGNIRRGWKTVEVRKTVPKCPFPIKAFLCESNTKGQIKAEFVIRDPVKVSREEILSGSDTARALAKRALLTMEALVSYMGDAPCLWFWDINDMVDYCSTKGCRIRNISEFGLKRVPQSWQYVSSPVGE